MAGRPRDVRERGGWFTWLFARHARSRLFDTFGQVRVAGRDALREALTVGPVLVIANHSTWWDPLVAIWLAHIELGADAHAMMDAANLERLPFFEKVGAFGVDLRSRRDGARAKDAASAMKITGLLDRPGRLVWIYPEGRERSPFSPLELRPGAAAVARLARCPVVPIATRFVFAAEEKPELWISIGAPAGERDLTSALTDELGRIDRALDLGSDNSGFDLIHRSPPSALGVVAERMLSWLVRFF